MAEVHIRLLKYNLIVDVFQIIKNGQYPPVIIWKDKNVLNNFSKEIIL